MDKNLTNELLKICQTLNKHNVKYLIVGGVAVALYGYYRLSHDKTGKVTEKPDLDIWYYPSYSNYYNLLNFIEELGQDVTKFREEQEPNPLTSFFRYEFDEFTLDLLPEIKAQIKFDNSFKKRETVEIENINIYFINYDDLMKDKIASSRSKDIDDIKHLNKKT